MILHVQDLGNSDFSDQIPIFSDFQLDLDLILIFPIIPIILVIREIGGIGKSEKIGKSAWIGKNG